MKSHTWHKIFCLFTCLLDSGVHYAVLMALLFLLIKLNQIIYAFSEAPETASTEWMVSSGAGGFVLADAPETASASLLFADSLVFSEAPETPSTLLSFLRHQKRHLFCFLQVLVQFVRGYQSIIG